MEGANQLNPLLRTGGEALAAQLPSNVTLTALDLSWNSLRAESAIALARALGENDGTNALAILGGENSSLAFLCFCVSLAVVVVVVVNERRPNRARPNTKKCGPRGYERLPRRAQTVAQHDVLWFSRVYHNGTSLPV